MRHENGLATLVRIPKPYDRWYRLHTFPYGVVPYDLDISPDGRLLSASVAEVNGDQFLRVWELDRACWPGRCKPLSEFRFGQSVPESFVFSQDGRYLYGSSYYTGVSNIFRYEVATGDVEAVSNAETGFFRPVPLADGRLVVLTYTGDGLRSRDHRAASDQGRQRDHVPGRRARGEVSGRQDVAGGAAQHRRRREADHRTRGRTFRWRNLALANAYPVLQGYKNYAGIGYHVQLRRSAPVREPRHHRCLHADSQPAQRASAATSTSTGRYEFWKAELSWNRSDFYDLFGPTKRSRKGYAAKLGYDWLLIYDEPRRSMLSSTSPSTTRSTRCRMRRTSTTTSRGS